MIIKKNNMKYNNQLLHIKNRFVTFLKDISRNKAKDKATLMIL